MKLLITLLLLSLPTALLAQSGNVPVPPDGPLIAKVQGNLSWEVSYRYANPPGSHAGGQVDEAQTHPGTLSDKLLSSCKVTKVGNSRFDQTITLSGLKTDRWTFDGIQITKSSGSALPILSEGAGSADYVHYSSNDFPEFSWISTANFVGLAKIAGRDCLVFKSDVSRANFAGPMTIDSARDPESVQKLSTVACMACTAVDTRLPVLLQIGTEMRQYVFYPSPSALDIPKEIRNMAEARTKRIHEIMSSFPGRPN